MAGWVKVRSRRSLQYCMGMSVNRIHYGIGSRGCPNAAVRGRRMLMQYMSLFGATDRTKCKPISFSALNTHPNCSSTRCHAYRSCPSVHVVNSRNQRDMYLSNISFGGITIQFASEAMAVHHRHHIIQRLQIDDRP